MAKTVAAAAFLGQAAAFAPGITGETSLRSVRAPGAADSLAQTGAAAARPRSTAAVATAAAAVAAAAAGAALARGRKGGRAPAVARCAAFANKVLETDPIADADVAAYKAKMDEYMKESKALPAFPSGEKYAELKSSGLIGAPSEAERFLIGGEEFYDPLGIAERCPQFLPWFREAELAHGRVCMVAFLGLVVPEFVRLPVPDSLEYCYSAPVLEAHNACAKSPSFMDGTMEKVLLFDMSAPLFQVLIFVTLGEFLVRVQRTIKIDAGLTLENAGDYQLGTSFLPRDEQGVKDMKLKELKNGRLAMIAYSGAICQALATQSGFPWMGAVAEKKPSVGFGASMKPASQGLARGSVAMRAEGGYKMSKAVPFLPVSPALEGYVGEEDGFDPIGMSLAFDIRWLREAELKHARVAMLAVVGWITTDLGVRIPGAPFENVGTLQAHDAMVKFGSMPQMLCWIGYLELFGFLAFVKMAEGETDRKPGDFGIRTWYPKDEKGQYDMQLKELRNGRLAMLAFAGIATVGAFTGKTWPFFGADMFAEGRAPRAVETRSGLCGASKTAARRAAAVAARAESSRSLPFLPKPQNLAGYVGEEQEFDPLGFSDTFDMKWLREAELKHGRVCMLATVGFAAQQYATFPGMKPTPNALDAVYTETNGLVTLIFLAGYIESVTYDGKITMLDMFEGKADKVPGDFNFGSGFLKGKSDKEVYDMKLKELNNGRLAMLAFGGMVHHNLVVNGPLFPLVPEGWAGPQGTWDQTSLWGAISSNEWLQAPTVPTVLKNYELITIATRAPTGPGGP